MTRFRRDPVVTRILLLFLATLGAAFLGYFQTLGNFFHSDDFDLVKGVASGGPFGIWSGGGLFLRPLASLSLFLDFTLYGLNPLGYQLTNLFVHALNALLVGILAWKVVREDVSGIFVPFSCGLFYSILPSHAEAVSWIAGRSDLQATLFCLLALVCYFSRDTLPSAGMLAYVCFAAALFSKESAACLPAVLAVLALLVQSPSDGRERGRLAQAYKASRGFLLILLIYLVVRRLVLGQWIGGYSGSLVDTNLADFPKLWVIRAIRSLGPPLSDGWSLAFYAICGGMLIRAFLGFRKICGKDCLILASAWVAACLPLGAIATALFSSQGERFLYLPSVFLLILAVRVTRRTSLSARPIGKILAAGLIVSCLFSLWSSNRNWRDAGILAEAVVRGPKPATNVVLVNAPDNLNGAYVFRNGLAAAFSLLRPEIGSVTPLFFVDVSSTKDQFALHEEAGVFELLHDGRPGRSRYTNQYVDPNIRFLPPRNRSSVRFIFREAERHEAGCLYVYSAGVLVAQGR